MQRTDPPVKPASRIFKAASRSVCLDPPVLLIAVVAFALPASLGPPVSVAAPAEAPTGVIADGADAEAGLRAPAEAKAQPEGNARPSPGAEAPRPPAPASGEFQPQDLEGPDEKVAALAALRLFQEITRRDAGRDEKRVSELTEYLLGQLNPEKLAAAESTLVAERIVDALATWITASGPPLEDMGKAMLPIVGQGPAQLRGNVVRAVGALIRYEVASSALRTSPTQALLLARFANDPPPSESFVRDASRIVWDTDGKALLGVLVDAVSSHAADPPQSETYRSATACLDELRARIPLDFPTVEGWQKWWTENQGQSLDAIIAGCWARNREEYLANWKQAVRRLRETGDAERLLLALQDVLSSSYAPELRTAAVVALGDYADWVLEMRFETPAAADGDPKDKLLRRGVGSLVPLLVHKGVYAERPAVTRAALAALRKYHTFIERSPDLLAEVSGVVAQRIAELAATRKGRGREEFLEALRLAGALRVESVRDLTRSLIAESEAGGGGKAATPDIELQTVAVTTLGRLVERKGVGPEGASLLIQCFKKPREGPERTVKDLRRACVNALATGSDSPEVRAKLYEFHHELLMAGDEKDLRIPAILALGTLARQGDESSLAALFRVLSGSPPFEPQEVIAAIDSIAYVGGRAAVSGFLKSSIVPRDKAIQDHLVRKTAAVIGAGGVKMLAETLETIESAALAEDAQGYLEFAIALWQEAQVKDLLGTGGQTSAGEDRTEFIWRATLSIARILDLQGMDTETLGVLTELSQLLQKDPTVKEKYPQGVKDLTDFRALIAKRGQVRSLLAQDGANDVAPVIKELESLVPPTASLSQRWRNLRWVYRRLAEGPPSERLEKIRDGWYQALGNQANAGVWEGFPAPFREKHLGRIEALKEKTRPPVTPPPPAPAPAPS